LTAQLSNGRPQQRSSGELELAVFGINGAVRGRNVA
jgi:hypothetical protein